MANDTDQEDLAAAWAAALEEDSGDAEPSDDAKATDATAEESTEGQGAADDEALANEWAAALAADEQATVQEEKVQEGLRPQAMDAQFTNMTSIAKAPRPDGQRRELDFILDIPLDVSAELGRTRLLINELLQLGQGSVVELNKLAGEPLEIFVNGKLVARGEAVVINEKFGVRLTDIISPMERVKQLA